MMAADPTRATATGLSPSRMAGMTKRTSTRPVMPNPASAASPRQRATPTTAPGKSTASGLTGARRRARGRSARGEQRGAAAYAAASGFCWTPGAGRGTTSSGAGAAVLSHVGQLGADGGVHVVAHGVGQGGQDRHRRDRPQAFDDFGDARELVGGHPGVDEWLPRVAEQKLDEALCDLVGVLLQSGG